MDVRSPGCTSEWSVFHTNDLAGVKVFPPPKGVEVPTSDSPTDTLCLSVSCLCRYACRIQSRKLGEIVNEPDSFLMSPGDCGDDHPVPPNKHRYTDSVSVDLLPANANLSLDVAKEMFVSAQQQDHSLSNCMSTQNCSGKPFAYFVDDTVAYWHIL